MSTLNFAINARSESATKTTIEARNFKFIIDEPEQLGGTDHGANPVEYLLGSLAGCLNVVGHVVAKELGIQLEGIDIDIEGDLDPTKFFGGPTTNRAGYSEIKVSVKPKTNADKESVTNWLAIVKERCPVSDNISSSTPVNINLG